jgi:hypothetical protein
MRHRELGSYTGPATIAVDGGSPVHVHCQFTVTQKLIEAGHQDWLPGMKGWRGSFRAEGFLSSSGAGTLTLPGGKSGDIIVTHLQVLDGQGVFTGSGEPPIETPDS